MPSDKKVLSGLDLISPESGVSQIPDNVVTKSGLDLLKPKSIPKTFDAELIFADDMSAQAQTSSDVPINEPTPWQPGGQKEAKRALNAITGIPTLTEEGFTPPSSKTGGLGTYGIYIPPEPKINREKVEEGLRLSRNDKTVMSKMVDSIVRKFIPRAESSARAVLDLVIADELKIDPHEVSPPMRDVYFGGFGESVPGLRSRALQDKKYPSIHPEALRGIRKAVYSAGQLSGDLPVYIATGAAGTILESPLGGLAVSFAATEGLRTAYSAILHDGEPEDLIDLVQMANKTALGTAKGAGVGLVTQALGTGVPESLGLKSGLAKEIVSLSAETAGFTSTGAFLDGRLPTAQEFAEGFATLAVLRYGMHPISTVQRARGATNLEKLWTRTAILPKGLERLVEEGKLSSDIIDEIANSNDVSNDTIVKVREKVQEMELQQAKLIAEQLAKQKELDAEKAIKKEQATKAKEYTEKKEKMESQKEALRRVLEEPPTEEDLAEYTADLAKEYGVPIEKVKEIAEAELEKMKRPVTEEDYEDMKEGEYRDALMEVSDVEHIWDEVSKGLKEKKKVFDVAPEVDEMVALEMNKGISLDDTFFRESNIDHTSGLRKIFESDPTTLRGAEGLSRYALNEVNHYLNGGKGVDITKAIDALSRLASEADKARDEFANKRAFEEWQSFISDAAAWARDTVRSKSERSDTSIRLNSMVPLDEVPKLVRGMLDIWKKVLPEFKDGISKDILYRNEEIYDATGFWLARDGKWRYWLTDKDMIVDWGKIGKDPVRLEDVVSHPTLFKAMPDMKDTKVRIDPNAEGNRHNRETNTLILNSPNTQSFVHELQHNINLRGGAFAGSSPWLADKQAMVDVLLHMKDIISDFDIKKDIDKKIIQLDVKEQIPESFESFIRPIRMKVRGTISEVDIEQALFDYLKSDAQSKYMSESGEMESRLSGILMNKSPKDIEAKRPWELLDEMLEVEQRELGVSYPKDTGTKLYSGMPIDKIADLIRESIRNIGRLKGGVRGSVGMNEADLITDITRIHTGGKVDADLTYSTGSMWRGTKIDPTHKFDKRVQKEGVVEADTSKRIPLDDNSIESAMFDPPFIAAQPSKLKTHDMSKRFTGFGNVNELWNYMKNTLNESYRVLKPGGKLIVKVQDFAMDVGNSTRQNYFTSSEMYNWAVQSGFRPVDRFINVNKSPRIPPGMTGESQKISRKMHSDYWVFEKPSKSYKHPTESGILYSGIDPSVVSKDVMNLAKGVSDYLRHARGMKSFKPGLASVRARDELVRAIVDKSGNIRRELINSLGDEGYRVVQKMYLSRGASSRAANMLKQMGKEVYRGLSRTEREVLDGVIFADRMIDIGKYKTSKDFKFPGGKGPVPFVAYRELFQLIEGLSSERAELINQRAQAYFDWMKKPLRDMLDEGLISAEEYNALSTHNYRRLKLVDIYDKRVPKVGKSKRSIYESGIESLARGRETDIFEPSSEIMALEVFNRAYGRIANNEANRALLDLARNDKTNPFVRYKESKADKIPSGWQRVYVFEGGERKAIYLSPEMANEWITKNVELSYRMSNLMRWFSGSAVVRTFATGINWGFAVANLPRDVMHAWFAARVYKDGKWQGVYNPTLPIYGLQMGIDQATVFTDALLRKGRYNDYINEHGGMEFLVHQGRLFQRGRHIRGPIDPILDFFAYFGETTEVMTRLAIRERVIKRLAKDKGISLDEARKDKSISQEATFAARDYLDFGQGGSVSKAADNAIPYLNASIQGTRGLLRSFKDNPKEASYKLAQLAALTTGLYIASKSIAPETMKSLEDDINAENNIIIPLGDQFAFTDEKGQTRYPYLKVPIDPGQRFFKKFFEASTAKWLGEDVDAIKVAKSLSNLSPVDISSLPPTLAASLGYYMNKDFWLNEDIWKKTDKPFSYPKSKEEYIPGVTPQAYIDLGEATGLSPERTQYAVEQLVTRGTLWSYLAGQGYDMAFGDMPKSQKEQVLAHVLSKTPMVKRFIGVTNPYAQFAEDVSEVKEDDSLERFIQTRGLDALVNGYLFEGTVNKGEIHKYIKQFKDIDIQDRLIDRYEFAVSIKDLPNRSFWLSLQSIPSAEARAKLYVNELNKASSEKRKELQEGMEIVENAGGIISDDFIDEVIRLRRSQLSE